MTGRSLVLLVVLQLFGCAESRLELNKELLRRAHAEVWSKGDMAVAEELYSPEFICHFVGGTEWVGLDGLKNQVTELRTAFPDWNEHIEEMIAERDFVVTRFTSSGTHLGDHPTLGARTGKKIKISEVAVHRIEDGKIVEQWGFPDVLSAQKQLSDETPG
jgi:steroid delta-isomerase-like uncharacterized protein